MATEEKQMKTVSIPKNTLDLAFNGSRIISIGRRSDKYESLVNAIVGRYRSSNSSLLWPKRLWNNWHSGIPQIPQTGYFHVSKICCTNNKFHTTICICIYVENGIIKRITKHLPYKGECRKKEERANGQIKDQA